MIFPVAGVVLFSSWLSCVWCICIQTDKRRTGSLLGANEEMIAPAAGVVLFALCLSCIWRIWMQKGKRRTGPPFEVDEESVAEINSANVCLPHWEAEVYDWQCHPNMVCVERKHPKTHIA